MKNAVEKFQKEAPIDYVASTISIFLVLMFAIVLSVSALFRTEQIDDTRCWPAVGELFAAGFTNVQLSTGQGVGGNGFINYAVKYVLPGSEGVLEQVLLHGPIVTGVDPGPTPVALTICGDGVASCVDKETETCLREGDEAGCGRLADNLRALGPNDVPVKADGRLVHLSNLLEEHPERFYVNVTSTTTPNGIHRGFIGPICRL